MVAFPAVGWDNHRVPIPPGAIIVADNATLEAELAKVVNGGVNQGDSVDLYLSGTLYDEIGWYNYEVADGGTGLRLYGNQDGTTEVRYTGNGMTQAHGACLRVGSQSNQFDDNNTFEIYNIEFNANSQNGRGDGGIWGVVIGASFDNDTNRSNCFNYRIEGCRIHSAQISLLKMDGNGGSNNGWAVGNTIHHSNSRARQGTGDGLGSGEGIYCGDGNTGRSYSGFHLIQNDVFDIFQGEAIEFKRNGSGCSCRFNLVHDNIVHTGGAIKNGGDQTEIEGNRIYDIRVTVESGTSTGNAFFHIRNTIMWNNVSWDTDVAVGAPNTGAPNQVIESFNNTMHVGTVGYRLNTDGTSFGPNPMLVNSDCDLMVTPDLETGDSQNLSFNGVVTTSTAAFVGPTTSGTANAGDGPGSGYQIDNETGLACPIPNTLANTDICGTDRTADPIVGAFSIAEPTPPIECTITAPADTTTDVTSPVLASGTSPQGVQSYQLSNPAGQIWNGSNFVNPTGTNADWLPATWSNGVWTATQAQTLPEDGTTITAKVRCC